MKVAPARARHGDTDPGAPRSPVRSAAVLFAALAAALSLSGCLQEVPIVSNETHNETTNMTMLEQRDWVEAQLEAGVAATGIRDGWFWGSATAVPWSDDPGDRELILESWLPHECGLGGRLMETVRIRTAIEDPARTAQLVRALWESEGWDVTDVWSDPVADEPHFRADREDGAFLGFQANREVMSLSAYSACSVNNTVTNWEDYVDDVPRQTEEEMQQEWDGE